MTWTTAHAITAVASALAALVCAYFSLVVRGEVAKLRAEIAESRMRDREDLRQWINGSFMRARETQAKLDEMEHRLDNVEIGFSVR